MKVFIVNPTPCLKYLFVVFSLVYTADVYIWHETAYMYTVCISYSDVCEACVCLQQCSCVVRVIVCISDVVMRSAVRRGL